MNEVPKFDFSTDRENKTIRVKRFFAAKLNLVWDAWTKTELIDQWWAPKPYLCKTKSMDFSPGGFWLYAMVSPTGDQHWCRADYTKIEPLEVFSAVDAFCDENGLINPDFPRSTWTTHFNERKGGTEVQIAISYKQLEDMDKMIQMGFKEGFTMGLNNLDRLLETLLNEHK